MTEEEGKDRLREALLKAGWLVDDEEPRVSVITRPEPRKYQWTYVPITHLSILLRPAETPAVVAKDLPLLIQQVLSRHPLDDPSIQFDRDETSGALLHLAIDLTYRCPRESLFSRVKDDSGGSDNS